MNVLEDSTRLFNNVVCRENIEKILTIMTSFTKSKRFDLALTFFSNSDKQRLHELFQN